MSGSALNTPGQPLTDAFYDFDASDPTMPLCSSPEVFRLAPDGESTCTCFIESQCQPNVSVSSLLAVPYPSYSPDHSYAVTIDLGSGPPKRLIFGFSDCGCGDNVGTFTLELHSSP